MTRLQTSSRRRKPLLYVPSQGTISESSVTIKKILPYLRRMLSLLMDQWPQLTRQISTLHKRAQEAAEKQTRAQYRFDARSNVSNERGTPVTSSGRASEVADDEDEVKGRIQQPVPMSQSMRGSNPVLSNITDRKAGKSPVKQLLHKERGSLGSSPDEFDHSQRL